MQDKVPPILIFFTFIYAGFLLFTFWVTYEINKRNLKIALFDKRHKFYIACVNLYRHAVEELELSKNEIDEFTRSLSYAHFVFNGDEEILKFKSDFYLHYLKLTAYKHTNLDKNLEKFSPEQFVMNYHPYLEQKYTPSVEQTVSSAERRGNGIDRIATYEHNDLIFKYLCVKDDDVFFIDTIKKFLKNIRSKILL